MSSESIGHFSIWGDFDPNQITAVLGLKPSSVIDRGEVLDVAGVPHTSPIATWDFHCPENANVNEQVTFLLNTLTTRVDALKELTAHYRAEFNLAPFEEDVLTLTPETLKQIGNMGISVNCFCWKDQEKNAD